ncbi:hypothetical protein ET33_02130 [Paenibacillus tyrfis]|uniref:Uncharacterized protein n=1 Tax=Paenibacillus tyrfis TaxID=1501230 RepID=A0A081P4C0_9BACL|nr:hypothetical protein ET33_02130 [Paenibacillus tyrfis]
MEFILFMFFGLLEVYALFALMFKTFRLPYFEYFKEISIIAVVVALTSYFIRVYFEINQLADIITHLVLYILFFRYMIKVKIWRGIIISLVYFGYGVLNLIIYLVLSNFGLVTEKLVNNPSSLDAFILQFATATSALLISYALHKFNLGFSFIIRPPHDFFIKSKIKRSDFVILTSIIIVACILMFTFYLIFHHKSFISIPMIILSYVVLLYLAYRKDMSRDN